MKILITADLHYDITRSQEPTRQIARQVCATVADALLIVGDIAGRDPEVIADCFRLFDDFSGAKFFVAGNHDVWTRPDESSLDRLEQLLPRIGREAGFHSLDIEPAEIDGVALIGSMGWYDYTFLPSEPRIPLRFYQAKIAPGAADRLGGYESLLEHRDDVPDWAWQVGTRWMDGQYVSLPCDDEQFCNRLLERLESHLSWAQKHCRKTIVGLHHVPYQELVPLFCDIPEASALKEEPRWIFTAPYMGSRRLGELLLQYSKVSHVYCGHTHFPARTQREHIECINIGSTYMEKRVEVLEI